jgi:ribonuclease D
MVDDKKMEPRLVAAPNELQALLKDIDGAARIAVDIESNGMFAYRPSICTVQLAWITPDGRTHVALVDTLACHVSGLAGLLENREIIKVIHDLAFDARVLHLEQVDLCAVRDTSVAASYLGKPGTGLASLLENELDVHVGKEMQNSDWARRPLSSESLAYLAGDVSHLLTLDTLLAQEVAEAGIGDEVATETAYRLIDALQVVPDPRPPHLRIRGNEKLDGIGRRVLEGIAAVREDLAEAQNLPPQRIINDKLLLTIADQRPRSIHDLLRFRAVKRLDQGNQDKLLRAIREALAKGPASTPPPPPAERPTHKVLAVRKGLEKRLQTWRRAEAERRQVNEQVVLPTHCMRRLVNALVDTPEAVAAIPGFGPARAERYAKQLANMMRGDRR